MDSISKLNAEFAEQASRLSPLPPLIRASLSGNVGAEWRDERQESSSNVATCSTPAEHVHRKENACQRCGLQFEHEASKVVLWRRTKKLKKRERLRSVSIGFKCTGCGTQSKCALLPRGKIGIDADEIELYDGSPFINVPIAITGGKESRPRRKSSPQSTPVTRKTTPVTRNAKGLGRKCASVNRLQRMVASSPSTQLGLMGGGKQLHHFLSSFSARNTQ